MTEQKTARALKGFVVKTGREKTITVRVDRTKLHAQYGKVIRPYSQFHVHDEGNVGQVGDKVLIKQSRPYSKTKTWELLEVIVKNN